MTAPRVVHQPSAHSAATRECTTCGTFVFWQMVDGLPTMVNMNRATRDQVVAHLLDPALRYDIFKAVPIGRSSVTMVTVSPVLLARHLATGGSLEAYPPLHVGHPHRGRPGRSGAPKPRYNGAAGPPPF